MIEELNVLLRKQTPTPPNEWLYQDYTEEDVVKRDFKPFVYLGKNAEPWPECEDRYKEGYDLLWSLRQEEHTADERQALEAQYASWQTANPDLVEEIDASVPAGLEPEQASHADEQPTNEERSES